MTVFYLIRHAHATWTPDENRPLSERGQQDALRVADLLGGQPIAAIYASTMRRAQQTVAKAGTTPENAVSSPPHGPCDFFGLVSGGRDLV